ncbi:MAG: thioesterase domain-containing protein, partial [Thermoanaerobaculia bacterium]
QRSLPEYMVPSAFVSLAAIPLSSNGKADRGMLARMDVTLSAGREYVAPRNETERRLVAIWADVLNLAPERIGLHDSFFDLGGHSLTSIQLISKTNREFGQTLPLAVLFIAPTIAAFVNLISTDDVPPMGILVPIQTGGDALPIFAIPGGGGNVLSLRPLARVFGDRQPLYGLQGVGSDGEAEPHTSVEQTARVNIAAVKSLQPSGPYRFVGHSYGGVVAFEMARMLVEQGEDVASLTLLDAIHPSRMTFLEEAADIAEACHALVELHGVAIEIDADRLRRSSIEENAQYLAGLMGDHGIEVDVGQFAAFMRVSRANRLSYRAYQPARLSRDIDVALYRATLADDFATLPPDYGWNQVLQSPIRVQDLEVDHYSILTADLRAGAEPIGRPS